MNIVKLIGPLFYSVHIWKLCYSTEIKIDDQRILDDEDDEPLIKYSSSLKYLLLDLQHFLFPELIPVNV